jgi:hypothetical protein
MSWVKVLQNFHEGPQNFSFPLRAFEKKPQRRVDRRGFFFVVA